MGTTSRKPAVLMGVGLLLTATLLAGCLSAEGQVIFDRTNQTRASERAGQLTDDNTLDQKAQKQAEAMAARHALFHSDLRANVPGGYLTLGENVGLASGLPEVYAAWLASAPHHANISNRSFTRMGVGAAKGSDGLWYVVQDFWG